MKTYTHNLTVEITVGVAGDEILRHEVRYKCQAWDNGVSDPTIQDVETTVSLDPTQSHPRWVTLEMLTACDAAAMVEFVRTMDKHEVG